MNVQICVGSSCHLKGSADIIELIQNAVADKGIADQVVLSGSFCMGVCNRIGVTVAVDGEVHTGITRDNFSEFFNEHIYKKLKG